jgi:hypothetical protein
MGIEPTSEVWEGVGKLGSFMTRAECKPLVRKRIQLGPERSCPQTGPL